MAFSSNGHATNTAVGLVFTGIAPGDLRQPDPQHRRPACLPLPGMVGQWRRDLLQPNLQLNFHPAGTIIDDYYVLVPSPRMDSDFAADIANVLPLVPAPRVFEDRRQYWMSRTFEYCEPAECQPRERRADRQARAPAPSPVTQIQSKPENPDQHQFQLPPFPWTSTGPQSPPLACGGISQRLRQLPWKKCAPDQIPPSHPPCWNRRRTY